MFLGTYAPRLDEKGRIILPAKFRDELESGLVVTRGQERCLYVFSSAQFAEMQGAIRQASLTNRQNRDFMRMFLSGAHAEIPDKQNRVTIPAPLRAYARLDRDLTVIGVGDRAEIWDSPSWSAYYEEQEAGFADQSEEVIPGLL